MLWRFIVTVYTHVSGLGFPREFVWAILGWDVAQLVTAADRHAADAGSIPRCGKEFSSQGQLLVQTLFRCPYTPVCNRMH